MEIDIKSFVAAISQIADEKGIAKEKVIESIEAAIAAAYKKEYGKKGQIIKSKLNMETGVAEFWQIKIVVSEDMIYSEEELEEMRKKAELAGEDFSKVEDSKPAYFTKDNLRKEGAVSVEIPVGEGSKVRFNPEKYIMLDEARKEDKKIETGAELKILLEARQDFGRIAAQTAKQVILQKIREAERDTILSEYKSKEGELASGIVQRIEGRNIYIDIGKAFGLLVREEQVPGEFYRPGQRLRVYILKVDETPKGPVVFLSRSYPKMVSKLFELEVPEIAEGQVEIKAIAREAGSRTKIAVQSLQEGIDPIGSAVGQRGTRVMAVINELGGEKIDIVEFSEDTEKFIANALSPAKVVEIKILPKNKALCFVPEDQLSLAIGKNGQNVRLAAKLTGWKIDVKAHGAEEAKADIPADEAKEAKGVEEEEKEKIISETNEKKEEKVKKSEVEHLTTEKHETGKSAEEEKSNKKKAENKKSTDKKIKIKT